MKSPAPANDPLELPSSSADLEMTRTSTIVSISSVPLSAATLQPEQTVKIECPSLNSSAPLVPPAARNSPAKASLPVPDKPAYTPAKKSARRSSYTHYVLRETVSVQGTGSVNEKLSPLNVTPARSGTATASSNETLHKLRPSAPKSKFKIRGMSRRSYGKSVNNNDPHLAIRRTQIRKCSLLSQSEMSGTLQEGRFINRQRTARRRVPNVPGQSKSGEITA